MHLHDVVLNQEMYTALWRGTQLNTGTTSPLPCFVNTCTVFHSLYNHSFIILHQIRR